MQFARGVGGGSSSGDTVWAGASLPTSPGDDGKWFYWNNGQWALTEIYFNTTLGTDGWSMNWPDSDGANSGFLPISGRNRITHGVDAWLVGADFNGINSRVLLTWGTLGNNVLQIGSTSINGGISILTAAAAPTTIGCGTATYTHNSGSGVFAFNSVNSAFFSALATGFYANNTSVLEVAYLASARRIIAIGLGASISTTEMPTNTGDRVAFLANAATAPSAVIGTNPPVGGAVFFCESGGVSTVNTGNVRCDLAPADQGGTSNWTKSQTLKRSKRSNTANSTPVQLDTYTLATNTIAVCKAWVRARDRTSDDHAGYHIVAAFKRRAAGTSIIGTAVVDAFESDSGWDATLDASGNDIRVTVTGDGTNTCDWDVDWEIHFSTV